MLVGSDQKPTGTQMKFLLDGDLNDNLDITKKDPQKMQLHS